MTKSKTLANNLINNTKRELQLESFINITSRYQKVCEGYSELHNDIIRITKKLEEAINESIDTLKKLGYDENGNEISGDKNND